MRNLLLLLLLANILYFMWAWYQEKPPETGVAVLRESELGPPMDVTTGAPEDTSESVGALMDSDQKTDLAAIVGRSCVTIGPFMDGAEANDAQTTQSGQGMRAEVRSTQGEVFVGHWVQIREIPDRAAGDSMIEQLKAGGVSDAYLVQESDGSFKISLGVFSELAGAERVAEQVRSLQLPVVVNQRMRDATVFYVDVGLPPGRGAGAIVDTYGENMVLLREEARCPSSN